MGLERDESGTDSKRIRLRQERVYGSKGVAIAPARLHHKERGKRTDVAHGDGRPGPGKLSEIQRPQHGGGIHHTLKSFVQPAENPHRQGVGRNRPQQFRGFTGSHGRAAGAGKRAQRCCNEGQDKYTLTHNPQI